MRERIKQVMAETFNLQAADIPDDAEIGDMEGWDSLGHVELVAALEAEFGVRIPTQAVIDLQTLPAIEAYLGSAGVTGG